jgi:hypothetical protein
MPSRTEAAKRGLAISFSTLDSAFSSRWPSPLRLAQNWKIYCTKQYSFLPLSVGHQTLGQSSLASAVRGLNQFPWKAPIGYTNTPDTNTGSNISPDPVRGPHPARLPCHCRWAVLRGRRTQGSHGNGSAFQQRPRDAAPELSPPATQRTALRMGCIRRCARKRSSSATEGARDNSALPDLQNEAELPNEEERPVGVGDGI